MKLVCIYTCISISLDIYSLFINGNCCNLVCFFTSYLLIRIQDTKWKISQNMYEQIYYYNVCETFVNNAIYDFIVLKYKLVFTLKNIAFFLLCCLSIYIKPIK